MEEFRRRLLEKMEAEGFGLDQLADSMIQVIKGEKVTEVYDKDGILVEKRVVVDPKDRARGLLIADALRGGDLGLTPQQAFIPNPAERMYARYAPTMDHRVNARLTPVARQAHPALAIVEPEPQPDPLHQALRLVAEDSNPDEDF